MLPMMRRWYWQLQLIDCADMCLFQKLITFGIRSNNFVIQLNNDCWMIVGHQITVVTFGVMAHDDDLVVAHGCGAWWFDGMFWWHLWRWFDGICGALKIVCQMWRIGFVGFNVSSFVLICADSHGCVDLCGHVWKVSIFEPCVVYCVAWFSFAQILLIWRV